jgi:UDPglucose--hexose-1-phosphate uridylyltransferase
MIFSIPHRRFNPLNGEWLLVSPQRGERPWKGHQEETKKEVALKYDPACYLCPGNKRIGGEVNPKYSSPFVFDNDNQAILPISDTSTNIDQFARNIFSTAKEEYGKCRVICYSERHDLTMGMMTQKQIEEIIHIWKKEYQEIGSDPQINHVQIFENKGEVMGCSNPHPHGQIWSQNSIPNEVLKECKTQTEYYQKNNSQLLLDYAIWEQKERKRVVMKNKSFLVVVPFWAIWPFETLVLPLFCLNSLSCLSLSQIQDLAGILLGLTNLYDKVFHISFPYSMGIHQSPTDQREHAEWQMHFHFYPPLLRSAAVKKFMVGYEFLAEPQRDITPESSADKLRGLF